MPASIRAGNPSNVAQATGTAAIAPAQCAATGGIMSSCMPTTALSGLLRPSSTAWKLLTGVRGTMVWSQAHHDHGWEIHQFGHARQGGDIALQFADALLLEEQAGIRLAEADAGVGARCDHGHRRARSGRLAEGFREVPVCLAPIVRSPAWTTQS